MRTIAQRDYMNILKWVIGVLGIINFGFMNFDGARALLVGDYVRPESGEYAGQLGPWSSLVTQIGIEPESDLMKWTFLLWGAIGLVLSVSIIMNIKFAPRALLILSVLTLWYLVPGTIISAIMSILLLIYLRKANSQVQQA